MTESLKTPNMIEVKTPEKYAPNKKLSMELEWRPD